MKQLLKRLKETIESDSNTIQFKVNNGYYELIRLRNGEWDLITLMGPELRLNVKKLKGLKREEAETLLKNTYKNLETY